MKTVTLISAAVVLLSACTASKQTSGTYNDDDVYASSKDIPVQTSPVNNAPVSTPQQITATEQVKVYPGDGSTQTPDNTGGNQDGNAKVANKYYESDFDSDDYYDYEYAVRMRRFYHPVSYYGYYDNYYTNSYWYNYEPACWGLSVYLGYQWWGPSYYTYSYYPNYYYSGCGNYGWGNGWGGGWCGGGWGYGGYGHGYGHGYNHGYNDGYWDGYWNGYNAGNYYGGGNNYYYNSHDNSGSYYGPHTNTAHANGNAISPHGKKFESAEFAGFTPVNNGSNNYQSVPRPNGSNSNGVTPKGGFQTNSNDNTLPVPSNTGVPKGTEQSIPRPVNPGNPNVNAVDNTNPNNLPVPSNTGVPKGTQQSTPRPVNPGNQNVAPVNNSNMNNLPVPSNNGVPKGTQQSDPRPVNPNSTPNNYEVPKNYETPKNYEAPKNNPPKNYEAPKSNPPKNYETPKSNPPKNYNPPKTNDTPRPRGSSSSNFSTPRPSGGGGGGNHSSGASRPSSGSFRHR